MTDEEKDLSYIDLLRKERDILKLECEVLKLRIVKRARLKELGPQLRMGGEGTSTDVILDVLPEEGPVSREVTNSDRRGEKTFR